MKATKILLVFVFSLLFQWSSAQYTLNLKIDGVKSAEGNILAAVYTSEDSFLKFDKVYKTSGSKAIEGTTQIAIKDLPKGTYAVAIFHDENGNNELDTNMLGIPKEPIAFSKGKMKMFGPPDFKDCAFSLESNSEIEISL
ncbi:DUF2141 domain-containing protein [Maribacter sp. 2210JD10-5]|uniref:DUF2141 domain-containing protein n=1 Tax=Maribacter sp. 2210JD10-5 TaxID=3386272 RepID=UPI0039BCC515